MARGEYTINNLYQPGYSTFKPGENTPSNYLKQQGLVSAGQMGLTTNPMVANQIGELSKVLNTGVVPVEVGTLDMKNFDTVPTEHWDEMRRKAELTDSKLTMHAPLVDPAGFNEKQVWDATQQQLAERQLISVIDKASQLVNKKNPEPIPVTIHAGNYSGSTYKIDPETGKKITEQIIGIDRNTGQLVPIAAEERYQIGSEKLGEKETPENMLESANRTQWRKEIDKVLYEKETADRIIDQVYPIYKNRYLQLRTGQVSPQELSPEERTAMDKLSIAESHLHDAHLSLNTAFEKAYKYGDKEAQKKLKEISNAFGEQVGEISEKKLKSMPKEELAQWQYRRLDLENQANAIQNVSEGMRNYRPEMIQRVEDFAIDKASQTLKKVALHAYDKSKKTGVMAPQLSLENLYQGMGFSQTQDLAKMIEKTRNEFQTALMQERKLSSTEAKKQAEQMIGATFDVGHLNMSRSKGYTEEHLKKEAEQIAKYVNKVHLTDNFGFGDSHLPVGMGNVPVKKLLSALGDRGKRLMKINEVGGWINAFGSVPYTQSLEAVGSPIYSSGNGPYWSQTTGFQQGYSGGFGTSLPQVNYETFGAGFSQLPSELGGSRGGQGGGRMGGGV